MTGCCCRTRCRRSSGSPGSAGRWPATACTDHEVAGQRPALPLMIRPGQRAPAPAHPTAPVG
ncbi:hypothetical protein E4416_16980 [Stenotrophomonas maltophilia]|nr:hypothetical protein E4418_19010 [Stenotrophomonas maltophilia]TIK69775.1 hypothetical protein E4416_16980 [Stenotrophomonas maltophilia]